MKTELSSSASAVGLIHYQKTNVLSYQYRKSNPITMSVQPKYYPPESRCNLQVGTSHVRKKNHKWLFQQPSGISSRPIDVYILRWNKPSSISSDNGLVPVGHQSLIKKGSRLIVKWTLCLINKQWFSFQNTYLKMSSAMLRPFCLGPDQL